VQRLFSTFPNSWPGAGLLLLRVCLATALIYLGAVSLSERPSQAIELAQNLVLAVSGVCVLVGLWTPLMGTLVAFDEVWIAASFHSLGHGDTWIHVLLAMLALSLAMLGPGAWSIDARLFGRKRLKIDGIRAKRPSNEVSEQ